MGKQLRIIGTFELKNGVYTSVASNRRAFEEGHPVQVPIGQISRYYPLDTRSKTVVGNPLNQLSLIAGETYFVPGEKRIILEAKQHQILFVSIADNNSLPQIYLQKPSGFHQAWLDTVRLKAAHRLKPAATLAHWEVEFLIGCVAGLGWRGLALVIGTDIIREATTRSKTDSINKTIRTLQVIYQFKKELRDVAPTLESVISDTIWLSLLRGQGEHLLPAMLQDPQSAARAAGTITVQLDRKRINERLTTSSIIWTLCSQFGLKATAKIPDATSKTIKEYDISTPEALANTVIKVAEERHITISEEKLGKISQEATRNPEEIAAIFTRMIKTMKLPPQ